jgi:hypothetical protein
MPDYPELLDTLQTVGEELYSGFELEPWFKDKVY